MELIDVLTPDGLPTGTVKPKRDVHRDGDWHRAAHLWIAWEGRVVLQKRALAKESWPGLWDISVAGHVSAGEAAIDAVIREAEEEIGIVVSPADLEHLGTLRYHCALRDGFVENEFHDVYLLRRDVDLGTLVLDPAEVAEVRWVALGELDAYDRVEHDEEYALLRESVLPSAAHEHVLVDLGSGRPRTSGR